MTAVKTWMAAMLVGAAALAGSGPALAGETFTVISGLPGGHPAVRIFRKQFRAAVEQQMAAAGDGLSVTWSPAYEGTIAKYGEVLEAVRDGVGQIGIIAVDNERKQLPLQDIGFHLPFVTHSCAIAAAAYHELHKQSAAMNRPWQRARQIYLANITTDGYGLFTGPKIKQIADLRGLNLAVAAHIETWLSGLAAKPVRLPLGQIGGAFDAGAIQGAIMPITELAEMELQRRLSNFLLAEFGPQTAYLITFNERSFVDLPAPARQALLAAADQFVPEGARAYCDDGAKIRAKLEKTSINTQRFFNSRRQQWVEALPPLGKIWAAAREAEGYPGNRLLTAYMDNLRARGAKPKRDWDRDQPPTN